MEETVKQQIINQVVLNPFQTSHQVAEKLHTSVQYVRGTMSEAGISFANMRKRAYRGAERRNRILTEKLRRCRDGISD